MAVVSLHVEVGLVGARMRIMSAFGAFAYQRWATISKVHRQLSKAGNIGITTKHLRNAMKYCLQCLPESFISIMLW